MVNVCSQIKCQNGGTCIQKEMDWRCSCQHGWTGLYCDIPNMSCQAVAISKGETLNNSLMSVKPTNLTGTVLKCKIAKQTKQNKVLNVSFDVLQVCQWTWSVSTQEGVWTKTTHTSVVVKEVIWAVTVRRRWTNASPTPAETEGPVSTTRVDITARYNWSLLLTLIYAIIQKFAVSKMFSKEIPYFMCPCF